MRIIKIYFQWWLRVLFELPHIQCLSALQTAANKYPLLLAQHLQTQISDRETCTQYLFCHQKALAGSGGGLVDLQPAEVNLTVYVGDAE